MRAVWLLLALGCGSGAEPRVPAKAVSVELWCGEQPAPLAITRDVKLDASTCGVAWDALELQSPGKTELVRAVPDREVWVRRTKDRAFVEIRTRDQRSTVDRVTAIRWLLPGAQQERAPEGITIVSAGNAQQLSMHALKQRFGAATERVTEISLCRLADAFADHPRAITVVGDEGETRRFTREECEQQGALLKLSGKGELRLRLGNGERVIRTVRRVEL
ncbi:MAG TPA: hypothetical protein VM513_29610 [Kofleriaceae bacterium]|jgi:hypothetical protein|nr:hypothetical protein [Kofleriaceae bacterium]